MLDPIIENRFKELPSFYQDFITSGYPEDAAQVFASSLNAPEENAADILEYGLMLYLLFFLTQKELIEYVSRNTGASIDNTEDVITTLCRHLPEFTNNLAYETARLSPKESPVLSPSLKPHTLSEDIKETEEILESLQGIRTMAKDMEALRSVETPIYQSNQADILNRKVVPPTPTDPPSWGSQ